MSTAWSIPTSTTWPFAPAPSTAPLQRPGTFAAAAGCWRTRRQTLPAAWGTSPARLPAELGWSHLPAPLPPLGAHLARPLSRRRDFRPDKAAVTPQEATMMLIEVQRQHEGGRCRGQLCRHRGRWTGRQDGLTLSQTGAERMWGEGRRSVATRN